MENDPLPLLFFLASTFVSILALMDVEALADFTIPVRASAFSGKNYKNVFNVHACTGIAKPTQASVSDIVSVCY